MTEVKDYDAIISDRRTAEGAGPVFKLAGREWSCLPDIPAYKMAIYTEKGDGVTFMDSLVFASSLVVEEQRDEFFNSIKDDTVSVFVMNLIIEDLMEAYSGRPQ